MTNATELPQTAEKDAPCPECGGREWSTCSDGLGDVASVAAICVLCRFVTTSVVDLSQNATESGSDAPHVLPPVSEGKVSGDLIYLTEVLALNGADISGGVLGGEYGYGAYFENETFMMHPYCWCEQDDCDWCAGCTCPDEADRHFLADGTEVSGEAFYDAGGFRHEGARVDKVPELACAMCRGDRERAPNFLHKATGTSVEWYKYIGRSMEVDLRGDWLSIFADCIASVKAA